jgi:pimeloyl-ACP methyl ester carboxylesterase
VNGTNTRHWQELRQVVDAILADSRLQERHVEVGSGRVHLVEAGSGPPVVVLHGTASSALSLHPILQRLPGRHVIAPDRPGQGQSDPTPIPRDRFREAAVAWVGDLLDALGLESAPLVGHSMGGLWALWYALAAPTRVERLVLLGPPQLPGTRCPLPFRVIGTPALGALVQRAAPPSPSSLLKFARFMGEGDTLPDHPELIDLLVAVGRDPVNAATDRNEVRAIVSSVALATRTGFRRSLRVAPGELRRLDVPTLLVWGQHEPLAEVAATRAIVEMLPAGRLAVLPGGHAPWLGDPEATSAVVAEFLG